MEILDTAAENWSGEGWYDCAPSSLQQADDNPEEEGESVSEDGVSEEQGVGTVEGESEGEGLFILKHLDRTLNVGRDEVIKLAQKGLDYDRVKAKYSELSEQKNQGSNAQEVSQEVLTDEDGEASTRAKRDADFSEFIERMPEVSAEDIPREVWAEVAEGKSLLMAYALHENGRLKAELSALRQNRSNREASVSSRSSEGSGIKLGELERLWYAED